MSAELPRYQAKPVMLPGCVLLRAIVFDLYIFVGRGARGLVWGGLAARVGGGGYIYPLYSVLASLFRRSAKQCRA